MTKERFYHYGAVFAAGMFSVILFIILAACSTAVLPEQQPIRASEFVYDQNAPEIHGQFVYDAAAPVIHASGFVAQ